MPSEDAQRLTALLTPTLGDWLYWPAEQCAAGHENTDYECGPLAGVGEACPLCIDKAVAKKRFPYRADRVSGKRLMFAESAYRRELEAHPDPAWVIGRGAPKDLGDGDTFWAAWGRWLAAVGADAPTMEVYWSQNNCTWAAAWPPHPWGPLHIATGDTPAEALRAEWLAWLERASGEGRP